MVTKKNNKLSATKGNAVKKPVANKKPIKSIKTIKTVEIKKTKPSIKKAVAKKTIPIKTVGKVAPKKKVPPAKKTVAVKKTVAEKKLKKIEPTQPKEVKTNTMSIEVKDENNKDVKIVSPETPLVEESPLSTYDSQLEEDVLDNTEVYDEGDIASALERGYIAQALQRHKEKLGPESHPDFDGETCVDCGCDIPELRLKMGKVRCVHCQEKLEKTNRLYAKK